MSIRPRPPTLLRLRDLKAHRLRAVAVGVRAIRDAAFARTYSGGLSMMTSRDRNAAVRHWGRAVLLLVVCGLMLTGCGESGPRRVTVTGSVTVDGQPIDAGAIRFLPTDNNKGPAVSGLISGGAFRLSGEAGPLPGVYRVLITQSIKPTSGKLAASAAAEPSRSEWQQSATVPDQAALQQDFKLSVNDPKVE